MELYDIYVSVVVILSAVITGLILKKILPGKLKRKATKFKPKIRFPYKGRMATVEEIMEGTDICYQTMYDRLQHQGLTAEQARNKVIGRKEIDGLTSRQRHSIKRKKLYEQHGGKFSVKDIYTHNGISRNIYEWAEALKIAPTTLMSRINTGWTLKETFETPAKGDRRVIWRNKQANQRQVENTVVYSSVPEKIVHGDIVEIESEVETKTN